MLSRLYSYFLVFSALLFVDQSVMHAQQFPCDGKLYFFGRDSNNVNYLSYVDGYVSGTHTVVNVFPLPVTNGSQNALAANPVDNYLYCLLGDTLYRIDASGNFTSVCQPLVNSNKATFDHLGRLWVVDNFNNLRCYDITTCTLIKGPFPLTTPLTGVDIAYSMSDCHLYMAGDTQIVQIDTTGIDTIIKPGFNTGFNGSFGGFTIGADGNLYGIPNGINPGEVYMYDLSNFSSGGLIYTFPSGSTASPCGCDMASFPCPYVKSVFTADPDSSCDAPLTVNFTNLSHGSINSWVWDFGDGSVDSINYHPTHTYTQTGTFTVTLTVMANSNCIYVPDDSSKYVIHVFDLPKAAFSAPGICFNNPTVFTNTSIGSVAQWNWNFGDGSSSVLTNPTHTYASPGVFNVWLTVTDSVGCTDSIQIPVTVHPLPAASFVSTTVCFGDSTHFTDVSSVAQGQITAWSWNFGDTASGSANVSTLQNPGHVYTAPGTYTVLLTVTTDKTCQSITTAVVTVLGLPVASFTAGNVCLNSPTQFTNTSTNTLNSFWMFGDGGISQQTNPTHSYQAIGTYTVTLIVSSTGNCSDTTYDTVTVNPVPMSNFVADSVCTGDSTSFTDMSGILLGTIDGWYWSFGDGAFDTIASPTHAYASAGTFSVSLVCTSDKGCVDTVFKSAVVHPLPNAQFSFTPSPNVTMVDGVEFTDLSTGNVNAWNWDFGDTAYSTLQNPIHNYTANGTFHISLVVTSIYGCVDTITDSVTVKDFSFYIPNAFSPNEDNLNDLFFGKGNGILQYEMTLFDRWGNEIFSCKVDDLPQTLPCMWDGKVQRGSTNEYVQQDVYVYRVVLTSIFNEEHTYIGHFSVIR